MRTVKLTLRGLPVYYEILGEGTPVIMLHGYQVDHRLMAGCMEPAFEGTTGYRRIYPDLPGMGLTGGADWIDGADAMLELLVDFIDGVLPGERFLLAGQSYGGYLARGLVRRLGGRVAGLMLVCPVSIPDRTRRALPPHVVLERDGALLGRLAPEDAEAFQGCVLQTEAVWERFQGEILPGLRAADQPFLARFREKGYAFSSDVDALEAPFPNPVLILAGRQDADVGYRDIWPILENYPRATFALLDRAGHNLQIEQSALFHALTREWLARTAE